MSDDAKVPVGQAYAEGEPAYETPGAVLAAAREEWAKDLATQAQMFEKTYGVKITRVVLEQQLVSAPMSKTLGSLKVAEPLLKVEIFLQL